jgi:hypothetical protein
VALVAWVQDVPHCTSRPSLTFKWTELHGYLALIEDEALDHLFVYRCSSPWHVSYRSLRGMTFFMRVSSTAIQHQAVSQGNKAAVKQLDDCESDSKLVTSGDPRRNVRTLL